MSIAKNTIEPKIQIKGGYYEFPLTPAERKITSGKWGTPMPSGQIQYIQLKPASRKKK